MSKLILALYLLAVLTMVAFAETDEFKLSSISMTVVGASRGLRMKRGPICWGHKVKRCCGTPTVEPAVLVLCVTFVVDKNRQYRTYIS
uniref:Uncharacterized protein n=1 Tax=Ditylenchus dipsaci TaxID=166011 RepID=A0A915CML0_9BILA